MKISRIESGKAMGSSAAAQERILPEVRPKGLVSDSPERRANMSPLEKGMAAAQEALAGEPDVREDIVGEIKKKIDAGQYKIDGKEVAEMMLRRLAADKIR